MFFIADTDILALLELQLKGNPVYFFFRTHERKE